MKAVPKLQTLKDNLVKSGQPIFDPEVLHFLKSIALDDMIQLWIPPFSVYIEAYSNWIRSGSANTTKGLSTFKYVYPSLGVTEALDHFILANTHRRIRFFKGEYPYNRDVLSLAGRQWSWLDNDNITENDAIIISHPFSATGDTHSLLNETLKQAQSLDVPVFMDAAFFGVCSGFDFDWSHPAIESVSFSLSKIFALGPLRTGITFSRKMKPNGEVLKAWSYGNGVGMRVGMKLFESFGPDFIVNKYKDSQIQICEQLELCPSNTLLFGIGGSEYQEYSRDDTYNRVCLSKALSLA